MTWAELNVDGYLLTGAFELTSMRLCSGPGSETFCDRYRNWWRDTPTDYSWPSDELHQLQTRILRCP